MKHPLINLISGGLLTVFSTYSSFAQEGTFRELPPVTIAVASSGPAASAKVNKMFTGYFKNASNLRWYELGKKFLVKFTMNGQENRALFTGSGRLVYHVAMARKTTYLPLSESLSKAPISTRKLQKCLK